MKIEVLDILKSELAINQEDGVLLFNAIKNIAPSELELSFNNISLISTAFLNESIGKYAQLFTININEVRFIFPKENKLLSYKVFDVIENALMGEEYSNLVDNALASL